MKTLSSIICILLAFIYISTAHSKPNQVWEYHVVTYPMTGQDSILAKELNKLGKLSWELVTCTEDKGFATCFFKRLKTD